MSQHPRRSLPPDREERTAPEAAERPPAVRLAVTRGELGLELYDVLELGPLEVVSLSLGLPGLRFPLDLSGGVAAFRHRRGVLQEVDLRAARSRLSRWLAHRTQGLLAGLERDPDVWLIDSGFGVGLVGREGAVAFDLYFAPDDEDGRFVVGRVRGAKLENPPLATALRVLDALGVGRREGRVLILEQIARTLVAAVLPGAGVRVPGTEAVRPGVLEHSADEARLAFESGLVAPPLSDTVLRALELAALTRTADDALSRGNFEAARAEYLKALERAPRHPEIVEIVAALDARGGAAPEAALGLIRESLPLEQAGLVAARLLHDAGENEAAQKALAHVANAETYAPLAALLFVELAALHEHAGLRASALDRAVAASPGSERVRWLRFEARVERGDTEGALADAQAIEQSTLGARARHDVLRRAARQLLKAGWRGQAGALFERALRYAPDDAASTAGLARALLAAGKHERAVSLLERAVRLGERSGQPDAEAVLDLAVVLAESARDLPQAIARARQIPAASPFVVKARALEAGWRERLGDLIGASLAYARVREAIELGSTDPDAAEFLREAARFERDYHRDWSAAERHLAAALRLSPRSDELLAEYRTAAAEVAAAARRPGSQ
ncbi:MAG TPA: tetratricopeptide repeat protein [Polyangiaceae bacterium]